MSELQQNRYDQLLRRVADLKGPGSKVNDVLGELFPTIDVENVPSELLLLMGSRLCMARTQTAAGGAGNFGIHLLRNAAGSGALGTLLALSVGGSAASNFNIGPTLNSGTPAGTRAFVDTRIFGQGTALVTMADNNSLVIGSNFFAFQSNASGQAWFVPPKGMAVVAPGTAFSVSNGTANQTLDVSWLWVERVAQPSELNL